MAYGRQGPELAAPNKASHDAYASWPWNCPVTDRTCRGWPRTLVRLAAWPLHSLMLSPWQRHADDCTRGCGGGHEIDAAGPSVQGRPEPDRALASATAGIPAALLAEVAVT